MPSPLNFQNWLSGSMGSLLAKAETSAFRELLTSRYYPYAIQFGSPEIRVLDELNSRYSVQLGVPGSDLRPSGVVSAMNSAPFATHTFDLVILPHSLDFTPDPYQLLREYTQIMTSDGYLILTGFQPYSLWGVSKLLRPASKQQPWAGNFYSVNRIQDWLLLLGFQIQAGQLLMYRPPVANPTIFDRLAFLESAGNRWWPMFGAVYIILAQLKTLRAIPVSKRSARSRIQSAFPRPVSQSQSSGNHS
ncbi:MAG: SAM-dependent methyltransferase [Parasphingorhabdus sp.]|jgi:SAM-dependent methyltransferase